MPTATEVYRSLAPAVLGYLRAERAPEPEDLLGEVFLQVSRDLGRFDGDASALRSWVFKIAHHRLIDARRRAARRPVVASSEMPDRAGTAVADPVDPALVAALARLTDEQREVVALRFVADLSLEAVAELTGRSVGAVKAMQRRALDALAVDPGLQP
ncbi:MAG TPA: sigma-70 family RNA polymerase sigma factor [Acidimicrobiales bacterium]|nr:sigma-70 family RNA polymerase sigma factor [Acidimicrobiales bacterium]